MRRKLELEAEKATPPTPENIVLLREILAELKKKEFLIEGREDAASLLF